MKQSSASNSVKSYSSKSYGLIYAGTVDRSFLIIPVAGECCHWTTGVITECTLRILAYVIWRVAGFVGA